MTREQNFSEIGRFFGEKSEIGRPGKETAVEKSNGKKSAKNRDKSAKNRKGAILPAAVGPCCARAELARRDR